jgi:hypothetical protein
MDERAHELAADGVSRGHSVAYLIDQVAWGHGVERKALLANLTSQAPLLARRSERRCPRAAR